MTLLHLMTQAVFNVVSWISCPGSSLTLTDYAHRERYTEVKRGEFLLCYLLCGYHCTYILSVSVYACVWFHYVALCKYVYQAVFVLIMCTFLCLCVPMCSA